MSPGDRVAHVPLGWEGEVLSLEAEYQDGTILYLIRWDDPGLDDDLYLREELRWLV